MDLCKKCITECVRDNILNVGDNVVEDSDCTNVDRTGKTRC